MKTIIVTGLLLTAIPTFADTITLKMKGRCDLGSPEITSDLTITRPSDWDQSTKWGGCQRDKFYKRDRNGNIDSSVLVELSDARLLPKVFSVKLGRSNFDFSNIEKESDWVIYNGLHCDQGFHFMNEGYLNSFLGTSRKGSMKTSGTLFFEATEHGILIQGVKLSSASGVCEFYVE